MVEERLKKKVFVTPEKPSDVEKTCWVEDEKEDRLESMVSCKKRKIKNVPS
ncbi:MAG: hypothetical protein QXH91_05410 [Candidatus Bathyarchaeia archaeon]